MNNIKVVIIGKEEDHASMLMQFRDGDYTQLTGARIVFEEPPTDLNVLGKKARDKITGFEGIITGHGKHLTGCDTYGLTPPVDKDGKVRDSCWFDEGRVEIMDEGVKPADVTAPKNGSCGDPKSTTDNPQ